MLRFALLYLFQDLILYVASLEIFIIWIYSSFTNIFRQPNIQVHGIV